MGLATLLEVTSLLIKMSVSLLCLKMATCSVACAVTYNVKPNNGTGLSSYTNAHLAEVSNEIKL